MNNREIKFRVWDKINKTYNSNPTIGITEDGSLKDLFRYDRTDEFVIEQFTGLKDSNGKEIYEGDILSVYHSHLNKYIWGEVFWINDYFQYFVKFYEGKEYFSTELKYIGNDWCLIGNRHENPELLK